MGFIWTVRWEVAQRKALIFGRRIETTFQNHKGYCILNEFNDTIWFVPYDKSYSYGSYQGEIKIQDFKKGVDK